MGAKGGAAVPMKHEATQNQGRRALLLSTAIVSMAVFGAAFGAVVAVSPAAAEPLQQVAQAERQWDFAIPAQDLASALIAYSETTGVQVVFKSEDLAGKASAGLSGAMTAEQGLRVLLASSGLTYDFTGENSVVVSAAPEAATEGGAVVLDTLTVEDYRNITSLQATKGYVSHYSTAATKTDTPIIETPQSVSTVGREEMNDRNTKTVAEAMRYTAGVAVDSYGVDPRGYDSIKIRGFDTVTTGSFRDGLRMDGNFFALYTTEPYGIERVDMMRGPSGALYGQAEAGGVIDRTTKRPYADMQQEVRLQGGSWEFKEGAFDIGGAATEDKSLLFRLTGLVRDSHTEFDYNDGSTQENRRVYIAPALTWNPDDDTSITVLADYMNDRRPTAFGTLATEDMRTDVVAGEPGFDRFDQEQFAIGYDARHRINDAWEFRQKARYTYVGVDYQGVSADAFDPATGTVFRSVWSAPDTVHQGVIDNQLESRFELGPTFHVALFGLDYSHSVDTFSYHSATADPLDINNVVYTGATVPEPYQRTEQTLQQAGAYVQDQITIYDNWILTLGGRFSYVRQETEDRFTHTSETKNDNAFTGRAGLTYLFDNGVAPYVSYTQGFTPQNGTTRQGETFVPEESEQYEVGVKFAPKDFNALFTVAAFQVTKTNVVTVDPDDINSSIQTGEIRTRGIELEAKTTLAEGLDLTASYTFLDAEVTKSNDEDLGKRPVIVPEHAAAAWLNYTIQDGLLEGLGIGGGLRYVGPTYNDLANDSENSSYLLVDAALSYDLNENLSFQVNANNLFDREHITTCAFGSCYYGTGLRVLAGMSYHW
ncbi:TonB-dependent siderophore receptor [Pelagibius sp. 7325]|uniref:TonB-dependent siderophore receptor n=1 Tax=Pelagibius sp. 7325 TaxID=3131994 RepID=UPI0030EC3AB3